MQERSMVVAAETADAPRAPAREADERLPALFAAYRDLAHLRYDYPLVLVETEDGGPHLRPLTTIINDILREIAPPGAAGEALRQQVLRLEGAIRRRVASGERASLTTLWRASAAELVAESGEPPFGPLEVNLDRAREALRVDGDVVDCDGKTPRAVIEHLWRAMHQAKAREFRKTVDGVILRLADILKADHIRSDDAHTAEALESTTGASFASAIDFHALSRTLSRTHPEDRLPDERRQRIRRTLMVLRSQRFYGPGRASERRPGQPEPHDYVFESCGAALAAFRARLPEMLEFTKALAVAELEIENKYRPELHDPVFERFDAGDLTAEQLALFPSALVCLRDGQSDNVETVRAFEALATGLPVKVLIQTDDILGDTSPGPSRTGFGAGSARLATMGLGCGSAHVVQASAAHLCRMGESLAAGMANDGPALFCIYSGATATARHVPPYILAAAATESRAFPSFAYRPAAGATWADRFRLDANPQPAADWPTYTLGYEDEALQARSEEVAFTFADFAICDARHGRYFRASEAGDDNILPIADCLKKADPDEDGPLPYILTIDAGNRLARTVADQKVVELTRRCRDTWKMLQEFAGIDNSHASRLLARELQKREEAAAGAEPGPARPAEPPAESAAPGAGEADTPAAEPVPPTEAEPVESETGPWIETSRCTTCNECTQINNRLFAYNENMQAYIADPDAGSYRQIVEAAESCQVSIIHPGQPRNPAEPDLEELMARAAPFN